MAHLSVQNISKSYDRHQVLQNINFDVPEQSIYGLLGPNGAGKTTLIRIINMINIADEGEILLDGNRINISDIAQIGYLPEERGLYKKMKVGEQALYLAQLKGLSSKDARKKLKFWFDKFEIGSWWDRKVEELSKGMQQKIQFIVTVLHEPRLLIFDEPFSGFDPINVNLLKDEILNLRNQGATIIFSTHNMASVEELCDQMALINKGKSILSGSIHEIKHQFKEHVFELGYQSAVSLNLNSEHYSILGETEFCGVRYAKVKILNQQVVPNDLLKDVISHVEVVSFREILPSLNDIFIQEVNKNH
ncbi:MAG: ATP-binding cassette domain-containing protein [Bacteroidales bacterium]|nr:ATP-binding cassette domain-containing protein [Bacteroidales bacterium]